MTHGRRKPDISEAERVLGWRPAISLKEGLTKTIPYFEELLSQRGRRRGGAAVNGVTP